MLKEAQAMSNAIRDRPQQKHLDSQFMIFGGIVIGCRIRFSTRSSENHERTG